jgi:hypothetical protein
MQACLQTPVDVLSRMGAAGHARIVERHRTVDAAAQLARLFEASAATDSPAPDGASRRLNPAG